jgi:hypothetical protein
MSTEMKALITMVDGRSGPQTRKRARMIASKSAQPATTVHPCANVSTVVDFIAASRMPNACSALLSYSRASKNNEHPTALPTVFFRKIFSRPEERRMIRSHARQRTLAVRPGFVTTANTSARH